MPTGGFTRLQRGLLLAGLLFIAAYEAVLVLGQANARWVVTVSDLGDVSGALLFAVACAIAARRSRGGSRWFWLLLAAAGALWLAAEGTWALYELVLDRAVPSPSWADIGYLSAPVVAAAALLAHPAAHPAGVRRGRAALDGLSVATSLLFLGWVFVLGPVWQQSDLSTYAGMVTAAYPFTDLVVVTLAVLTLVRASGTDRASLVWVLGGLLVLATADSGYAYLAASGDYNTGGWIDGGWTLGYLCVAFGAFLVPRSARAGLAVDAPVGEPEFTVLSAVAPFVPVLLALGAAGVRPDAVARLDTPAKLMALALVLLVLARQGLAVLDRGRDRAHQDRAHDLGLT